MRASDGPFVGSIPEIYDRHLAPLFFEPYASDVARRARALGGARVLEIAMSLPFDARAFDLVVCRFGVMFFPDRGRAFREASRVLSDRGAYLFDVWDGVAHNDVARIVSEAAAKIFPHDPPRFIERVPHGQGDPAAIERDPRAAGFDDVRSERVVERSRCPSARHAAIGVCEGTPWRHEIAARDAARLPIAKGSRARSAK